MSFQVPFFVTSDQNYNLFEDSFATFLGIKCSSMLKGYQLMSCREITVVNSENYKKHTLWTN
jgi:hypothetical protein